MCLLMPLEESFDDLCSGLANLRIALQLVQAAAAQDEKICADLNHFADLLDGLTKVAQKARKAACHPVDVDNTRRTLPRCQRQFNLLKAEFRARMGGPERIEELRKAGREEVAWHIGRCYEPLAAAERALTACWLGLGEYAVLKPGGVIPGFAPPRS